jgi:hypothetical protein
VLAPPNSRLQRTSARHALRISAQAARGPKPLNRRPLDVTRSAVRARAGHVVHRIAVTHFRCATSAANVRASLSRPQMLSSLVSAPQFTLTFGRYLEGAAYFFACNHQ